MKKKVKLQLLFSDRIGIVFDITRLMMEQGVNINAMEVEQQKGKAKISMELEGDRHLFESSLLFKLFSSLDGLESQKELRRLPQERREQLYRTLFDGMSEGIISVDANGIINTINSVACRILGQVYENVIGTHVAVMSPKDSILLECIEKKIPVGRRKFAVTDTGRVEFYGSATPLKDSFGNFVGAVLLMKNLKEVKELVDAVSQPIPLTFEDFLGGNIVVKNLITFAKKVADTVATVSITGESGTGKELFARAIHFESGRHGPFIPINCAALPEQLIESELFGYVDGAFTGAKKKGKPGLFEAAQDGTIFLDEIGDMPQGPQAKILRVLQEGLVRRLGGFEEVPVNARVITATNKNLKEMVEKNLFREDLFYRINVLTIQIPPLRERLEDIPLLTEEFLHQFNQKLCKPDQTLSEGAMGRLRSHNWPGNVRELKNVIERAAVLSDSEKIDIDAILLNHESVHAVLARGQNLSFGSGDSLKSLVGGFEVGILLEVLNATPSIRNASSCLGISHTALIKKIKKYELSNGNKSNQWK